VLAVLRLLYSAGLGWQEVRATPEVFRDPQAFVMEFQNCAWNSKIVRGIPKLKFDFPSFCLPQHSTTRTFFWALRRAAF
jgi:hypothetical protein